MILMGLVVEGLWVVGGGWTWAVETRPEGTDQDGVQLEGGSATTNKTTRHPGWSVGSLCDYSLRTMPGTSIEAILFSSHSPSSDPLLELEPERVTKPPMMISLGSSDTISQKRGNVGVAVEGVVG